MESTMLDAFRTLVTVAVGILLSTPVAVYAQPSKPANDIQVLHTPEGVRFGLLGAKPAKPVPILFVFATSLEVSLGSKSYAECGTILAKHGFLSVSLDLPCHGKERTATDAEGIAGWRVRLEKGEDPVRELTARSSKVLDHLIQEGYADAKRIAACGTSRGGFMALHFAAAEPRIKCVAAFAPVTNLLALREFAATKAPERAKALALTNQAERLAGRPVWLCISNHDERVSTDDAIAFTRRVTAAAIAESKTKAPPIELHVMPSLGHSIHRTAHQEAAAWILSAMPERKPR
jgi:dienelactone hydrolase